MNYVDLDNTAAYEKILRLVHRGWEFNYAELLTAERVRSALSPMGGGLTYSWAAKNVDDEVLGYLQALADEQELIGKYQAVLEGETMNTGESRKVLHHLTRSPRGLSVTGKAVLYGGKDLGAFYAQELERVADFACRVHGGEIRGSTGKPFAAAIQIGIGGSDLGPRALYIALEQWAAVAGKQRLRASFISNVDPDDASGIIEKADLEETVFILVSKSGTTQETLANELFIKQKLINAGLDPSKHILAVTSETSPLAHNPAYLDSFYIDDFIGGRYSSTSAVGAVALSLAFGPDVFMELIAGAHEGDALSLNPHLAQNAAMLDALIGVWERNFLGYPYTAILPYSQALSRFPAHLQQLDMESNGKRVNRDGNPVVYPTGPVVFGEPGTNGQHSFYQLLHQGTDIVPLQFIGFLESQRGDDIILDGTGSQTKLTANLAAQIVAFAKGQEDENRNKEFIGGRPSSLIVGKQLTPAALGALLSHYENKIMFQGFAWNLNSFDQEGVQLGKVLTTKVLSALATGKSSGDSALDAYSRLLGIA